MYFLYLISCSQKLPVVPEQKQKNDYIYCNTYNY